MIGLVLDATPGRVPIKDRADKTLCFIGETDCGCFVAACVIDGRPKDEARFVADLARQGLRIRTETVAWARENLRFCSHANAKPGADGQPGLFDEARA